MLNILIMIFNLIGSAMPLIILCYMLVFITKGRKVRQKTIWSYLTVAIIMFGILLRT